MMGSQSSFASTVRLVHVDRTHQAFHWQMENFMTIECYSVPLGGVRREGVMYNIMMWPRMSPLELDDQFALYKDVGNNYITKHPEGSTDQPSRFRYGS